MLKDNFDISIILKLDVQTVLNFFQNTEQTKKNNRIRNPAVNRRNTIYLMHIGHQFGHNPAGFQFGICFITSGAERSILYLLRLRTRFGRKTECPRSLVNF